jgi:hypothetical protein
MAGVVLSLFLMVSEIVFMRKRVSGIRTRLMNFYRSGRFLRFFIDLFAISAFFLLQPVVIGYLVVMALDNVHPGFSDSVIRGIRQALTAMFS